MRTAAGILTAALIAATTLAAPAVVQAQTSTESSSVTTTVTTPLPYHNNGPVQYDESTQSFVVNGTAMSNAQAAAYFQKHDPLYWGTLKSEFETTPAEFADHWDQLAFNLPPMGQPTGVSAVSADAPI